MKKVAIIGTAFIPRKLMEVEPLDIIIDDTTTQHVEFEIKNYRIEPSQGTHFFQNLTSFGVGYFTINPFINDGLFDSDFLQSQPALFETEYLRHIRFENPMVIKINGKK